MIGMDVLIVGSLAYDSLETPHGSRNEELGGSASYGGFSAAFHNRRISGDGVGLVGVIGEDFNPEHLAWYTSAGLNISGIESTSGHTFRWKGSYHGNMAEAITHETHLNVFEHFQPKVPDSHRTPKVLMCANLHPSLQSAVLSQTNAQRMSILDSMNLWINIAHDQLLEVMREVDLVVLNDGEVRMLASDENLVRAAHKVLEMMNGGILVVKRGEHGVIALHPDGFISMPAYPTSDIIDPTGCGDSFAGAMSQFLANGSGEVTRKELAESLVHATVTASFTIENFGSERLRNLTVEEYNQRLEEFRIISNTS